MTSDDMCGQRLDDGDYSNFSLFLCGVNGWNLPSDNGIMVTLLVASVNSWIVGSNVGYDS